MNKVNIFPEQQQDQKKPKRGDKHDIFVALSRDANQSDSGNEFQTECEQLLNRGKIHYEKQELNQYQIQVYLYEKRIKVKKADQVKQKPQKTDKKTKKLNKTKSMQSLQSEDEENDEDSQDNLNFLSKYLSQQEKPDYMKSSFDGNQIELEEEEEEEDQLEEESSEVVDNENRKKELKLNILYINREFFSQFSSIEELNFILEACYIPETKNTIILENIKDMATQNHIKGMLKENLENQKQNREQVTENIRNNNSSQEMENQAKGKKRLSEKLNSDELQNWMCSLYIEFDYDVVEITDVKESLEYFANCMRIVAEMNYPRAQGEYDAKAKRIDEQKARNAGVSDPDQIAWINMLMTVHLLSDNKALAVSKKYKNLQELMKGYMSLHNIKDRQLMLQDIQIENPSSKTDKSQRLGKALSQKIYKVFISQDPKEFINQ